MKVELHCHTSRYSACAKATPSALMEELIRFGYGAVYLTEHDAVWSEWEIEQLQTGFPDVRIFGGVELSVIDEDIIHILVLGTTDPAYLSLRREADILAKAAAEGHLAVLAHPFRWPGAAEMLRRGHLPDALEHRTMNQGAKLAKLAAQAAEQFGLPLVNAGDTHDLGFLNRFWIETDRPLTRADDIRAVIANGGYVNRVAGK